MTEPLKLDAPIHLQKEHLICAFHGDLFRPKWPRGFQLFSRHGIPLLNQCPVFINNTEDSADAIKASLIDKSLCCWLQGRLLYELLQMVQELDDEDISGPLLWEYGKCVGCGRNAPGCRVGKYVTPIFARLCLQCFAYNNS